MAAPMPILVARWQRGVLSCGPGRGPALVREDGGTSKAWVAVEAAARFPAQTAARSCPVPSSNQKTPGTGTLVEIGQPKGSQDPLATELGAAEDPAQFRRSAQGRCGRLISDVVEDMRRKCINQRSGRGEDVFSVTKGKTQWANEARRGLSPEIASETSASKPSIKRTSEVEERMSDG
jgi:hypothetical protein